MRSSTEVIPDIGVKHVGPSGRKNLSYNSSFKRRVLRELERDGRTIKGVAKRFCMPHTTLRGWIKRGGISVDTKAPQYSEDDWIRVDPYLGVIADRQIAMMPGVQQSASTIRARRRDKHIPCCGHRTDLGPMHTPVSTVIYNWPRSKELNDHIVFLKNYKLMRRLHDQPCH